MSGGLLTLTALAMADTLFNRSIASLRNLLFVAITGTSAVVMTGLPEVLAPDLPERVLMLLKASMGPAGAAIALNYLGIWLGGMREDPIVHRITVWGCGALLFSAIALALLATQVSTTDFHALLMATAAINLMAVLLGIVVAVRAATLGDPLARWMVLACACLAVMVYGLYLRGLKVEGFGLGTWLLTATCTVAYFLVATALVILRNRQNRQLAHLADLQFGADPATGLPTGSVLHSKVEHAFWRTARLHGRCTVVCVYLRNLYELGESAGHGVEHQILAATAARIRRAAGFRCVVGLYHPRCFVVVIDADRHHSPVNMTVARLRSTVGTPLSVVGSDQTRHDFSPRLGMGVLTVNPVDVDPMDVLNEVERQALATIRAPQSVPEHAIETVW